MEVINFIKDYWVLIVGILVPFLLFCWNIIQAIKCSLRNDILDIFEKAEARGNKIKKWELDAILHSAEIYFKLKGNSFVQDIVELVKRFELID